MVHVRLNERESNPNPHVNFITALPAADPESARQLLRALAAQVRPVMKAHGLVINSLEEYEHNAVFAGRNWNNGETIELVLRRPGGSFLPTSWLMSTLCHELAHIKHMNHGPAFQSLWKQLRVEVRKLQDKGYYGDGYWSSGKRLADSATISVEGVESGDFPEYMCGGAQSRKRPTVARRSRSGPRSNGASDRTGAQTEKKRRPGSRVTSKYSFTGEGLSLTEGNTHAQGTGFGKKAGSKRAREERALAAERRHRMVSRQAKASGSKRAASEPSDEDVPEEVLPETDAERRRALLSSEKEDFQQLSPRPNSWKAYDHDFVFHGRERSDVIDLSSDCDGEEEPCDLPPVSGSTFTTGALSRFPNKGRVKNLEASRQASSKSSGFGMVETEINFRKEESMIMASAKSSLPPPNGTPHIALWEWPCHVCTLINKPGHLACSACATPRGQR